jgi:hypothetical protein
MGGIFIGRREKMRVKDRLNGRLYSAILGIIDGRYKLLIFVAKM